MQPPAYGSHIDILSGGSSINMSLTRSENVYADFFETQYSELGNILPESRPDNELSTVDANPCANYQNAAPSTKDSGMADNPYAETPASQHAAMPSTEHSDAPTGNKLGPDCSLYAVPNKGKTAFGQEKNHDQS